jgi:hypothetical protein
MSSWTGMLKYLSGSFAKDVLSFGPVEGKYQLPGKGHVELSFMAFSFTSLTAKSASFNC